MFTFVLIKNINLYHSATEMVYSVKTSVFCPFRSSMLMNVNYRGGGYFTLFNQVKKVFTPYSILQNHPIFISKRQKTGCVFFGLLSAIDTISSLLHKKRKLFYVCQDPQSVLIYNQIRIFLIINPNNMKV